VPTSARPRWPIAQRSLGRCPFACDWWLRLPARCVANAPPYTALAYRRPPPQTAAEEMLTGMSTSELKSCAVVEVRACCNAAKPAVAGRHHSRTQVRCDATVGEAARAVWQQVPSVAERWPDWSLGGGDAPGPILLRYSGSTLLNLEYERTLEVGARAHGPAAPRCFAETDSGLVAVVRHWCRGRGVLRHAADPAPAAATVGR
jgi:hypothetical protein